MTLRQFIQVQYGIRVDVIEKIVTVGVTPTAIVGNNPNRLSYTLSNTSQQSIYTAENPSVSVNNGFQVTPAGFQTFDWRTDGDTVGYELNGISSAPSTIFVREVVIIPDETLVA